MSHLQISPLFSVPFGHANLDDSQELCDELTTLFLAREAEGERYKNAIRRDTQVGLFESRFDLHTWPDPPIQRVFAFIHTTLAYAVQRLNDYPPDIYRRLILNYHSWFHVTRTGGNQGVHNHPMASWSGIFCVDPGDSPPNEPTSGCVRFLDPRPGVDMFSDPGNERLQGQYHAGGFQTRHEAGRLLLFPSYVHHEVFPYRGMRPRIVIAFNSWITLDPAEQGQSTKEATA